MYDVVQEVVYELVVVQDVVYELVVDLVVVFEVDRLVEA